MARMQRIQLKHRSDSAMRPPLLSVYAKLNELLDAVQNASETTDAAREQISCVILEEDLRCLMEECEQYLLEGLPRGELTLRSFLTRSVTVIDESCQVLKERKVISLNVLRYARMLHTDS